MPISIHTEAEAQHTDDLLVASFTKEKQQVFNASLLLGLALAESMPIMFPLYQLGELSRQLPNIHEVAVSSEIIRFVLNNQIIPAGYIELIINVLENVESYIETWDVANLQLASVLNGVTINEKTKIDLSELIHDLLDFAY